MIDEKMREQLVAAACAARSQAYSPYSNYAVGAALLGADGHIYTGVNVENASYSLTMCAERNAIHHMVTAGCRRIVAIAVCTENAGSPCGACRQVMAEFAGDIPVWLADRNGFHRARTLYELLPDHFGPEQLS